MTTTHDVDGITITPISEIDRGSVVRMWAALFHAYEGAGDGGRRVASGERLDTEIQSWIDLVMPGADHFSLIVRRLGAVRGFVAVSTFIQPWLIPERSATIGAIWVEPTERLHGLGRLLVVSALEELTRRNVDLADVHAIASNHRSKPFWQSLGFKAFAVQMRYTVKSLSA